jgi:hypothetical protein
MSGKGGKPRKFPGIKGKRPDRKAQRVADAIARAERKAAERKAAGK